MNKDTPNNDSDYFANLKRQIRPVKFVWLDSSQPEYVQVVDAAIARATNPDNTILAISWQA
jgi:hypothetical protein